MKYIEDVYLHISQSVLPTYNTYTAYFSHQRHRQTDGEMTCVGWLVSWLSSVLRPHQHGIGYMGDGFYRSKNPTNSIKVLKENLERKTTQRTQTKHKFAHMHTHTK